MKINQREYIENLGEIIEQTDESYLFKVDNIAMPKLIAEMTTNHQILDIEIISVPLEEMIEDIFEQSKK